MNLEKKKLAIEREKAWIDLAKSVLANPAVTVIGGCVLAQYARNHYYIADNSRVPYLDQTANAGIQATLVSVPVVQALASSPGLMQALGLILK